MRVISGKAKGFKLESPKNMSTRPTSDRVKESVFNTIQGDIYDKTIIDLYSGTGSLGIEALSRGARRAYFIENSRKCIKIIERNLRKTQLLSKSNIICADVIRAIIKLAKKNIKADIIFLDPPYNKNLARGTIEYICKYELLNPMGIIIIEHGKKENLPKEIDKTISFKGKYFGNTGVSFYRQKEEV